MLSIVVLRPVSRGRIHETVLETKIAFKINYRKFVSAILKHQTFLNICIV